MKFIYAGRNLGSRPLDNSVINFDGKIDLDKIEKKEWYQKAVSKFIELSKSSKIAIMWSKENPEQCHRGYIISHTLLKMKEDVFHVRGDKSIEKAHFFSKTRSIILMNKIYTIGVYGFNEEEFFNNIVSANIDTFVDIRKRRGVRGSKYSFANSKRLQAKLKELGVK